MLMLGWFGWESTLWDMVCKLRLEHAGAICHVRSRDDLWEAILRDAAGRQRVPGRFRTFFVPRVQPRAGMRRKMKTNMPLVSSLTPLQRIKNLSVNGFSHNLRQQERRILYWCVT